MRKEGESGDWTWILRRSVVLQRDRGSKMADLPSAEAGKTKSHTEKKKGPEETTGASVQGGYGTDKGSRGLNNQKPSPKTVRR